MNPTTRRFGTAALAALLVTGLTHSPASAKDGDGRIVRSGSCSASADWKLKVKPDDGRIEVEWEVDSNRIGQRWAWTIRHDRTTVSSGRRTTKAPSGSFSVERRVGDAAGTHTITATARNLRSGQKCRASVRI
jgi:hypothetical protein